MTNTSIISQPLVDLQCGNIEHLILSTNFNSNWTNNNPQRDSRNGNSAAQIAADSDNYRTAIARACTFNKVATINKSNMSMSMDFTPTQYHYHLDTMTAPTHNQFNYSNYPVTFAIL